MEGPSFSALLRRGISTMSRVLASSRHLLSFLRLIAVRGGSNVNGACANTGPKVCLLSPPSFSVCFDGRAPVALRPR